MNSESNNDNAKVIDFPGDESIEAQAARWLAALDVDDPSESTLAAFRVWINEDEAHRREFESIAALWSELNILTQVCPPRASGAAVDRAIKSWWPAYVAVFVIAVFSLVFMHSVREPQRMDYMTSVGEQKTIELPDKSVMLLNTDSRVSVNYTGTLRSITLERGEALFEVAHDKTKPFEVSVGDRVVRAVGTAFSVHLQSDDVEVIVTEGVIEIERASSVSQKIISKIELSSEVLEQPQENTTRVEAGNRASFTDDQSRQILVAEIERIENEVSWRNGVLTFDREPLEKVVSEMARYTTKKVIVPEKEVREIIVGGVFKVGDTKSFFEALQLGFGIQAIEAEDNVIYLSRIDLLSK